MVAVVILLCVHSLLVSLIVIAFLAMTRVSRIGDNAWQSFAQMHSPPLKDLLRSSTIIKDDDAKNEIAAVEKGKDVVIIGLVEEWGKERVGLRKRHL